MRKCHLFLFVLFLLLSIFVSCNPDNAVGTGTLELNIESKVSRGLQAVSMETNSYTVEIVDSSEKCVWTNANSNSRNTNYSFEVAAGTYTVKVNAFNKSGQIIGKGSASVTVQAGKSSSCSVSVMEIQGNGTFQFLIAGPQGFSIEYDITSTSGAKYSGAIGYSESSGAYVATVELPNGFYEFSVSIPDFDKPLKTDAVRILADQTVVYSAEFTADGSGKVAIFNEITTTPSIDIAFSSDRVKENDSLTVTCTVEGLGENFTSKWFIDEVKMESYSDTTGFELDLSGYSVGEHTVTCIVSSGDVVWSQSKVFIVYDGSFDGHYVGRRDYYNYWYFFDIENGEITYSYYEGSLVEYETVPYTTKESEDGNFLIFKVGRRIYDYALFLPSDPNDYSTKTLLYYVYGVDENGESVDSYVGVNLEKKQTAVLWTSSGYEPYSETYHVGLLESEYVTARTNTRESHTLDANGVCSVCGYDGHDFDIMDDVSYVSEGGGYLYVSRYWPGEFKLSDGSVVSEGNRFYVQKYSGYWRDRYTLYYPAAIYDTYEAGGSSVCYNREALGWYLRTYHPDFEFDSLYRINDIKVFLESLFALEWKEPSSEDVSSSTGRTTVFSDTSLIDTDAEGFILTAYNKNTLSIDDTAITEENGIYFNNASEYVIIYYPMIIRELYEKAQGFNPDSGNPFWAYVGIYFPELDTSQKNYVEVVTTLINGYVEPKLEDFVTYVNKK